jgi:hypothetical protein
MKRGFAPRDLRIPISFVRSVTETSMMFMMPMPATSSAMMPMMNAPILIPTGLDEIFAGCSDAYWRSQRRPPTRPD